LSKETESQGIFYGWFVVAACFAATFTLGAGMFMFGVFFKPLENEFGWTRALISSGYTAFLMGYALSSIASGRLADRYSPRPILLMSAILAGLGTSLCSLTHSINQFRIFLFIGGLGGGATWSIPTSIVQRWFYNKGGAGPALGVVAASVGVGGIIFAPLINYLIMSYGWRKAYLVAGSLFLIIIAASSLVIKKSPTETGKTSASKADTPNPVSTQVWRTGQVLANPAFAAITFIHCVVVLAFYILTVHLVPYAIDIGVSPVASAAALGLFGGFSVPGRILSGFISETVHWQRILALSCFGMAVFAVWLVFLREVWMLYCFVFFYGLCHGCRLPAHLGILGEFFGMHSLGEIIGISQAIALLVGAFAPYLAGFIFDAAGSYVVVFLIVTVLQFSSSIVASRMRKPVTPQLLTCDDLS
jgi:MFS family permease